MSTRTTSRLEAGLIARKGEAIPAAAPPLGQAAKVEMGAQSKESPSAPPVTPPAQLPHGLHGTIAVTVRLDPARYERLKIHGARKRLTNQDILVAALDAYLKQHAE